MGVCPRADFDNALDIHVHKMHLEGVVEHLHDVDDMRRLSDEFMRVNEGSTSHKGALA